MDRKYEPLNKLKGLIREKGSSYRRLSQETGISLNALCSKINGYSLFDIVEVSKVCAALDIDSGDIAIFFAIDVA